MVFEILYYDGAEAAKRLCVPDEKVPECLRGITVRLECDLEWEIHVESLPRDDAASVRIGSGDKVVKVYFDTCYASRGEIGPHLTLSGKPGTGLYRRYRLCKQSYFFQDIWYDRYAVNDLKWDIRGILSA